MKTNNKGFSLVELIVVIAIMAILAAVAIPTFATFITKANVAADEDFTNGVKYAVNLALAADGDEAATITVVMNSNGEGIKSLSYTLVGDTATPATSYVVIGTNAPTNNEIVDTIVATIDSNYKLKTDGTDVEVDGVEISLAAN